MNTFSQVWVFSDTPSRLPELMNGAQALANQINTFVLNDADDTPKHTQHLSLIHI